MGRRERNYGGALVPLEICRQLVAPYAVQKLMGQEIPPTEIALLVEWYKGAICCTPPDIAAAKQALKEGGLFEEVKARLLADPRRKDLNPAR